VSSGLAEQLIANAKAVLLDFDGPVTPLMPPPTSARAAEAARRALPPGLELPVRISGSTDHLEVLRFVAERLTAHERAVEGACTAAVVDAARRSTPVPPSKHSWPTVTHAACRSRL
jgi:hypothetical protein